MTTVPEKPDPPDPTPEDKKRELWEKVKFILLIFIVLAVSASYLGFAFFKLDEFSVRGAFGDTFNGLFTGIALLLIAINTYYTRLDLNLQRKELKLATKAHQESVVALNMQNDLTLLSLIEEKHKKEIEIFDVLAQRLRKKIENLRIGATN